MKHGGNVWEAGDPSQWLDFSANLRPEGPPDWVAEILREGGAQARYYPDREMRRAVQGLSACLGVPEEWILPTAGGAEAIDLVLSLAKGDVVTAPVTFGEYAERAAIHGRKVIRQAEAYRAGQTVILCNPNNPTGEAWERERVLDLWRRAQAGGAELIVDEAFIHYCPQHSVCEEVAAGLSVVGSFTKVLGVPGVRLGYLCACPERIQKARRRQLPWALNAWAVEIARALPLHARQIREEAAINQARRERFCAQLIKLGAAVRPTQANFLLADFGRDMTAAAQRLKERHILVRTCASFGLGPSVWRLAVKTDEQNNALLTALRDVEEGFPCAENA